MSKYRSPHYRPFWVLIAGSFRVIWFLFIVIVIHFIVDKRTAPFCFQYSVYYQGRNQRIGIYRRTDVRRHLTFIRSRWDGVVVNGAISNEHSSSELKVSGSRDYPSSGDSSPYHAYLIYPFYLVQLTLSPDNPCLCSDELCSFDYSPLCYYQGRTRD